MLRGNKGRVLRLKTGYNPNSSSVGTNLSPMLTLGAAAVLALPVLSFLVTRKVRRFLEKRARREESARD